MKIKHLASKAAMAALLLTGLASAQTNPDVVVHQIGVDGGDTNDIVYYGTGDNIAAYSFGTQSCNIGTTELVWGSTENHPVISQNMFRLQDERFLHIGQSWLKHGFCAVNEPGCGSCQSSPCSTLGVGCADTYWASLNDGRTGGPKYQIEASIGSHPHPFPSPSGNSTIRGRLQVHLEDIDQSINGNGSAEYFIEGHYISEDDAIHGNAGNNASWRKVNVVSHTNIDGNGPTNVGEAALHAWKDAVPSVELVRINNLNEGGANRHAFYWLGCNVKDNGDGTYTYMYAVHNLNSTQSCGAFSIPVLPTAVLTDVFFHDVDYHSGEPYNGLDWTHDISGGEITWETAETYAQNNDANALRWGTVYNFGFTTASSPQDVTATLSMFEPGISTSLTGPTKGPGTPPTLSITFPDGIPEIVDPTGSTTLRVNTAPGTDSAVAGSGVLYVDVAGSTTAISMTDTLPGEHEVNFPAVDCGSQFDWYVSFDLTSGGTHSSPSSAPAVTYESLSIQVATMAEDDLESDSGWIVGDPADTATTGVWERVDPLGTGAQPDDDHSPSGSMCYVTGQGSSGGSLGENDVDSGTTTLYSPVYDLSGSMDPVVSYWRWYSNDSGASPNADIFTVQISNDSGSSWSDVEVLGPSGAGTAGGWIQHQFSVSSLVTPSSSVQLRFLASDLGSGSIVEAAIDDLEIIEVCPSNGPGISFCSGDGSGTACPCGNTGGAGEGCANDTGSGARLSGSGSSSVGADDLVLSTTNLTNGPGLFFQGDNAVNGGDGNTFGDGLRCAGGTVRRLEITFANTGNGFTASTTISIATDGAVNIGDTKRYQYWYRDTGSSPCSTLFNLSNGYEITWGA
jgi:hypothetical protein